jgi:hypothetical protein
VGQDIKTVFIVRIHEQYRDYFIYTFGELVGSDLHFFRNSWRPVGRRAILDHGSPFWEGTND